MLKLKFFGTGHAAYNENIIPGFPRQQSYQILCFLLLSHRRPQLRETLCSLFWNEYSSPVARKYLRNALWRLRQSFESVNANPDDYFMMEEDCVSFIFSSPYWLDVEAFENTLTHYQSMRGEDLTANQANELERAINLYTGDLLEGNYEDWCIYERERLSLLYLKGLSCLMNFHEKNGSYKNGLDFGQKILDRDNTREGVHLQMMRLYYRIGDRDALINQYKQCRQVLERELNLQPMKETTNVYHMMLNDQYVLPENKPLNFPIEHLAAYHTTVSPSFVEYALDKLQKLQAILDDTSAEMHQLENILNNALVQSKNS